MKKPQVPKKMPQLNFAKVGMILLVVLCLAVLIYDMANTGLDDPLAVDTPVLSEVTDPLTAPDDATPKPQEPQQGNVQSEDSFYSEYRLQREQVRSEELELLQSIIDDANSSQEMRDIASARKIAIAESMEYELMTENVLYAKDFGQTVVMLGKDTATVVLSGQLDDVTAAQVADAVTGVTGVSFENVVIINR